MQLYSYRPFSNFRYIRGNGNCRPCWWARTYWWNYGLAIACVHHGSLVCSCRLFETRHKASEVRFYRFPCVMEKVQALDCCSAKKECWMLDWIASEGDANVWGDHFTTGMLYNDPSHRDYVPSLSMGYERPSIAASSLWLEQIFWIPSTYPMSNFRS